MSAISVFLITDISFETIKTKRTFSKKVLSKLSHAKSFLKGFWGFKSKLKEEDQCKEEESKEDNSKEDESKEDEDSDIDGEGEDSVHRMRESRPDFLVQMHGGSEDMEPAFPRSLSDPEAVINWGQHTRAPPIASKSERNLGRQHHPQLGNWTGSPTGAGGAQGKVIPFSLAPGRSNKLAPTEESASKIVVERSIASLSCYSHSRPHPGGGLQVERSLPSLQPQNKRRQACNNRSIRHSLECGGGDFLSSKLSLPNLYPSSPLGAPQYAGNSAAFVTEIHNFSDTLPTKAGPRGRRKVSCTGEGGNRKLRGSEAGSDTQVTKVGLRGEHKMSCGGLVEGDVRKLRGSEAGTDTQPTKVGSRCERKISYIELVEGGIRKLRGSEAGSDTQPTKVGPRGERKLSCTGEGGIRKLRGSEAGSDIQLTKVGPRGGRKMSFTESVDIQHAHVLQPPKASRRQPHFSKISLPSALTVAWLLGGFQVARGGSPAGSSPDPLCVGIAMNF
eukprot:gene3214-13232_t